MTKFVKDELGNEVEIEVTYKNMDIEDIIKWCQENGEVKWLKEIAATTFPVKDAEGKPVLKKDGQPKTRNISFIELKLAFVKKFMSELAPKAKAKTVSMYDRIGNL